MKYRDTALEEKSIGIHAYSPLRDLELAGSDFRR